MYSIPFEDNRVKELITWYIKALQKAIDIIWDNTTWKYDIKNFRRKRHIKVKVPVIPKECQVQERTKE